MKSTMCGMILSDDWSEYEVRKMRSNERREFVELTREWEVNYLTQKIFKYYPIDAAKIREAIKTCASEMPQPHKRDSFVERVFEHMQLLN